MTEKSIDIQLDKLGINDSFSFNCYKELECFNKCCRDINLFLTPYDILRIKRRLKIPSSEFLKIYTFPLFPEEVGHPVILMKMVPDETKNCPFVSDEGCMIYDDRPWSCRSFPLEAVTENTDPEFELVKRDFCLGFTGNKNYSGKKWRDNKKIRSDETELLRFAFKWLRHVLFRESTVKRI